MTAFTGAPQQDSAGAPPRSTTLEDACQDNPSLGSTPSKFTLQLDEAEEKRATADPSVEECMRPRMEDWKFVTAHLHLGLEHQWSHSSISSIAGYAQDWGFYVPEHYLVYLRLVCT